VAPGVAVNEGVGNALTVTAAVVTVVEQEPVVAVSVYTPALPGTTPATDVLKEVGLLIAVPPGLVHE